MASDTGSRQEILGKNLGLANRAKSTLLFMSSMSLLGSRNREAETLWIPMDSIDHNGVHQVFIAVSVTWQEKCRNGTPEGSVDLTQDNLLDSIQGR